MTSQDPYNKALMAYNMGDYGATDGTYNGWAMLYETCRQVVKQNGYKKLIVYILESERNETKMVKEGDK